MVNYPSGVGVGLEVWWSTEIIGRAQVGLQWKGLKHFIGMVFTKVETPQAG